MSNPYQPIESKIEEIIVETPNIKTFILRPMEHFPFKTGQFAEVTLPGIGEAPFTPSSSPFEKELVEFTIMEVGFVTKKLHNMREGDIVGIRGPYGKGYPVEQFYGKELLILGGGVGMAPLRSLVLTVLAHKDRFKRVVLAYGARTPSDIVFKKEFDRWRDYNSMEIYRSVDKKDHTWNETEGVVTLLLDKFKMDIADAAAIVCGPPVMMKFSTFKLLELGHRPENIFLSMEKNMSCGLGKCGHCILGQYFVCKDGPVFSYDKIKHIPEIWD